MKKLFTGLLKFIVAVPLIAVCIFMLLRAEVDSQYSDRYTNQITTQSETITQLQEQLDEANRQLAVYKEAEKTDYILNCTMTLRFLPGLAGDILQMEYPLVLHTTRAHFEQVESGDDITSNTALLTCPESGFWSGWSVTVDSKQAVTQDP